jgi:hypothetical protein
MMTLLSFLPHRFSGLAHQSGACPFRNSALRNKKSRRKRTPAVFNCVGLLVNGCFGCWPNNPLFSHPKSSIFGERLTGSAIRNTHTTLIGQLSKTIPGISDIPAFPDENAGWDRKCRCGGHEPL